MKKQSLGKSLSEIPEFSDSLLGKKKNILFSKEEEIKVLRESREIFGDQFLIQLLKEECLELALAIQKLYERGYTEKRYENLLEEICDVEIMIEHAKEIFPKDRIQRYRRQKFQRQIKRNLEAKKKIQ